MHQTMFLVIFNASLLLTWLLLRRYFSRSSTTVPVVPGLPLLGNVIALGRGGVAFITQCRQKFGDVFCLRLLNQRMVFVFDPSMLTLFLKAPEDTISFKPAVEQFTERVYGLPSAEFFALHEPLLATLRQLLVPDKLEVLAQQLMQYAQPELDRWKQQGRVEMWSACQSLVFGSAGQVLFGRAFFNRHGLAHLQETFLSFEENFEVAASPVPQLLLPKFRAARARLLSMFAESLSQGDFKGCVVEKLLLGCGMSERYWPNLLLAVLWASQANSMPALFWSLAMLLLPEQETARQRVLTELQQAAVQQPHVTCVRDGCEQQPAQQFTVDTATASAMVRLAMDKRSFVSRCVAEAIRLRLHSIAVRFVSADGVTLTVKPSQNSSSTADSTCILSQSPPRQQQQVLHVPRGSILAICPFESHHDAALYPADPWRFNPDRAGVQGLEPGSVVPGIAGLGFGGGFWRCPGRFFAEMELALLVQLVLHQIQLLPDTVDASKGNTGDSSQSQQQEGHLTGVMHGKAATSTMIWRVCKTCLPDTLLDWARDVAVFGAGVCGGSQQQGKAWCCSGDPQQLLPAPNLLRLVGFKIPMSPWWVRVESPGLGCGLQ